MPSTELYNNYTDLLRKLYDVSDQLKFIENLITDYRSREKDEFIYLIYQVDKLSIDLHHIFINMDNRIFHKK